MSERDGGPAFPLHTDDGHGYEVKHFGMSLRDYFAAAALQGMCSVMPEEEIDERANGIRGARILAAAAYVIADAMLKQRELSHE